MTAAEATCFHGDDAQIEPRSDFRQLEPFEIVHAHDGAASRPKQVDRVGKNSELLKPLVLAIERRPGIGNSSGIGEVFIAGDGFIKTRHERPGTAAAQFHFGHVDYDGVQPGAKGGATVKRIEVTICREQAFLHGVFGILLVAEQPGGDFFETRDARSEELVESIGISAPCHVQGVT